MFQILCFFIITNFLTFKLTSLIALIPNICLFPLSYNCCLWYLNFLSLLTITFSNFFSDFLSFISEDYLCLSNPLSLFFLWQTATSQLWQPNKEALFFSKEKVISFALRNNNRKKDSHIQMGLGCKMVHLQVIHWFNL